MPTDRAVFVPLCVGYGARLLGKPPGWHRETESFLACVKRERALLRPGRWVPMGDLGWVGAAAAADPAPERVLGSAVGRAYRGALASLGGAACPLLPGPWTVARQLPGDDLEARLDDAVLLLANLCRTLTDRNRDLFVWDDFLAGEAGPMTEGYGPVYRVLEHCNARAWFVVTGRGLEALEAYRHPRVAAVLFPELDVRAHGEVRDGDRRVGFGLPRGALQADDGTFDARGIAAAASRAACFAPLVDACAVPENVVRLVDALPAAATDEARAPSGGGT